MTPEQQIKSLTTTIEKISEQVGRLTTLIELQQKQLDYHQTALKILLVEKKNEI